MLCVKVALQWSLSKHGHTCGTTYRCVIHIISCHAQVAASIELWCTTLLPRPGCSEEHARLAKPELFPHFCFMAAWRKEHLRAGSNEVTGSCDVTFVS